MDVQVKQRLTGAVILVAGLVLLVPELLTGPGDATVRGAAGEGEVPLRSYTLDLSDPERGGEVLKAAPALIRPQPAAQVARAAEPAVTPPAASSRSAAEQPAVTPAPVAERSAPAPVTAAKPTPQPAAESPRRPVQVSKAEPPATKAAPASGDWMVQVGSFSSRVNAERLVRDLESKGFEVLLTESSGGGRRLFRVRVGPASDRDRARALAERVRASGQAGAVVSRN